MENSKPLELVRDVPAQQTGGGLTLQDDPAMYQSIGAITLAPEERSVLDKAAEMENVAVRPTGEVYLSHEWYRVRLRQAFGVGGFGQRVLNTWKEEESEGNTILYVRLALFIRGSFIADAIGSHTYRAKNVRLDYSDAFESAKSNALVRCCKAAGLGLEPWSPKFRNDFLRDHCVKVIVNDGGKMLSRWRRKDAEPFEGEIPPKTTDSKDGADAIKKDAGSPPASPSNATPPPTPSASSSETLIELDSGPKPASYEHVARLRELTANMNQDAVKASLRQRRVATFEELTEKQADNILRKLEGK